MTLEIFSESVSTGPLDERMKEDRLRGLVSRLGSEEAAKRTLGLEEDDDLTLPWTTLREYLDFLVEKGVSPNVASFVGAPTVRIHELGYEDRAPTEAELQRMESLVREAMEQGALGVGSSLIYAAAFYADTEELAARARARRRTEGCTSPTCAAKETA